KIEEHYKMLIENNILGERQRRKALYELNEALRGYILEPILDELVRTGEFSQMVEQLVAKEADPYTLAEEVARRYMNGKVSVC
ncbi:MAG TPA: methylmalonyl Co-A mutase-associated GTPase MeaB, partial [Syntrophothermus lipocalidus]|nr:methylmalonyl Co-A mutase-associated GTPase MeaB [Syntrophothermus lipocalidus]